MAMAVFGNVRAFEVVLVARCAMAVVDKKRLVTLKMKCTNDFIQQVWEVKERVER
jgi:hypothetical protein